MKLAAPAKINWLLRVLNRRDDGFHEIETIFQTIDLEDQLEIEEAGSLTITCSDRSIPTDRTNLVAKAWTAVKEATGCPPVRIHLSKGIPSGGGLGGGSSDAAATILALDSLFALGLGSGRKHEIAASVGSDVPFFLEGGTQYGTGRGEILETLPSMASGYLLLVLPDERVATPEAYERLKRSANTDRERLGIAGAGEIARAGVEEARERLTNDFEEVVFAELPILRHYRNRLEQSGALWAGMTGSGSTIVGWFAEETARDQAAEDLGSIVQVQTARPVAGHAG